MLTKLPPAARRALRLASRAARDAVDARCAALSVREPASLLDVLPALPGLAPRLCSLSSLSLDIWSVGRDPSAAKAHCAALAGALERLPSPAALTALEIVLPSSLPNAAPLVAALGRFSALRSLRVVFVASELGVSVCESVAQLLSTATCLPALVTLGLSVRGDDPRFAWEELAELLPPADALPLWGRLEALELRDDAVRPLLALLTTADAGVAPQLSRLRALDAVLCSETRYGDGLAAMFAAPWLPQLTRLALGVVAGRDLYKLLGSLPAPGATGAGAAAGRDAPSARPPAPAPAPAPLLRAIRELDLDFYGEESFLDVPCASDVRRLLAAANLATLEALALTGADYGVPALIAARAAEMPELRALGLFSGDMVDHPFADPGDHSAPTAAWGALRGAPFAQLTRLDTGGGGGWLVSGPERLAALLSAPWAASLAELTLGYEGFGTDGFAPCAGALAPLSGLPRLRKLRLVNIGLAGEAPCALLLEPGDTGWARRLVDLEVVGFTSLPPATLVALAALPFERLERLRVEPLWWVSVADLRTFAAAGVAWLPRLELLDLQSCPREVCRAAADVDGPLRALHRGGGEVLVTELIW